MCFVCWHFVDSLHNVFLLDWLNRDGVGIVGLLLLGVLLPGGIKLLTFALEARQLALDVFSTCFSADSFRAPVVVVFISYLLSKNTTILHCLVLLTMAVIHLTTVFIAVFITAWLCSILWLAVAGVRLLMNSLLTNPWCSLHGWRCLHRLSQLHELRFAHIRSLRVLRVLHAAATTRRDACAVRSRFLELHLLALFSFLRVGSV